MVDSYPPGTLTVEVVRNKLEEMRNALPRATPDTPYGRAVRDEIARCMFISLHPADVLDADLVCHIILLNAHADDCLRLAAQATHDPKFARGARTQARSMMRLMRGMLGDLHARQLTRAEARTAQPHPTPALFQPCPIPPPGEAPAAPGADVGEQAAARIRELDLRMIETPGTRH